jgi:hypothetical protein
MRRTAFGLICLLLLLSLPVSASDAETQFQLDSNPDTLGDYFSYSLDMSGQISQFYDIFEDRSVRLIQTNNVSDMRMELISTSGCEHANQSNCMRVSNSWVFNLTIHFNLDSGFDNDLILIESSVQSIMEFDLGNKAWDTGTNTMSMWYAVDGIDYHYQEISETSEEITKHVQEPSIVSLNDSWVEKETTDSETVTRSRTNADDWEFEYEEETNETTTSFAAESIGNVFIDGVGTECLKISSSETGSNNTNYAYIDKNGLPIKMEIHEDGTIMMIATLSEYQWANEPIPSEAEQMENEVIPFLSVVSTTTAILFATSLRREQ